MNQTPQQLFEAAGGTIEDAQLSSMFGKACFKYLGKAFCSFHDDCIVFKLNGDVHAQALALPESQLFDPSGKGRPMREWVQVTAEHADKWPGYAAEACLYVTSLQK